MSLHSPFSRLLPAALLLATSLSQAAPALPGLGAKTSDITVSGISSGGYMAVQFQVAFSSSVRGAGVLAGGPYYCAEGSVSRALANCMEPAGKEVPPTAGATEQTLKQFADAGRIDPRDKLRDDRAWLLSGGQDKTVAPAVMDALDAFYRSILPADAVRYIKVLNAGHAMLSIADTKPNACNTSSPPFINRCENLDAAGELLNFLLAPLQGELKPPIQPAAGDILSFDQRPYIQGIPTDSSLGHEGYAYVPAACRAGGCRIHVAFHGCRQSASEIGRRFVEGAGYNNWAASNRLIVLYPQTTTRYGFAWGSFRWLYNPKGCWDWWGYTGTDYATHDGLQMRAVRAMIDALGQPVKP